MECNVICPPAVGQTNCNAIQNGLSCYAFSQRDRVIVCFGRSYQGHIGRECQIPDEKFVDVRRKTNWHPRTPGVQQPAISVIQGGINQGQLAAYGVDQGYDDIFCFVFESVLAVICWFRTNQKRLVRVPWLMDSGNLVPGSAAISTISLQVNEAATAGKLEVAVKVASLFMATTPWTFQELKDVVVYHTLSHPLNLGLNFLTEFKAQLNYS
ncbi:MAG: hypothetical protein GY696_31385 [Gammaproteobacteria bacterium]|nr:hypothetical protein [Gammaproteobacteria bacterium]